MLLGEISKITTLVRKNEIVRNVTICITLFSIVIGIVFSYVAAFIIFISYIFGILVGWTLIRYSANISICLQRLANFYRAHLLVKKEKPQCSVCSSDSCTRQRLHTTTPWKELYISTELNVACEHFFNRIIKEFVSSWYTDFTKDTAFITELKYVLRFSSASLINKLLNVNVSNIISKKLVPSATKHVDDYLCMQQIAKLKYLAVNDVAVEYLGRRLHIAVVNRDNELSYLRHLTSGILPYIVPPEYLSCRNFFILMREILAGWVLLPLMDVIADPNMINSLVILITTHKSKGHISQNSQCIDFLHNFTKNAGCSSFSCDLKTVLKTTDLFYVFMQFLKKTGPVHMLQFLLDIEDFNSKLLTPDMSKRQLETLHSQASNLYKIYFDSESTEFIGCSPKIQLQLLQLLQDGVYNVAKLRTSEPLYKAYDYAFTMLESDWLPEFFHSNEFYNYICGAKVTAAYSKGVSNTRSKKFETLLSQGPVSKISSSLDRIKGVLKPNQPVEGALYPGDFQIYANGPAEFVEDILMPDCESIFRDLSAWRISIPSIEIQQITGSKSTYLFNISIQRIDTISESGIKHWIVQRKDQDFYTLKTKLIEFHGENEICEDSSLPSRRVTTSIEMRRFKYEEFLRNLLQKHSLRGSDLLHTFLTTDQDFTLIVTTTLPVVEDLGNIYQSVAFKLRKEKGQHLDSFVNNFLASTSKPKSNRFEWAEISDEIEISVPSRNKSDAPATFTSKVFKNNFNVLKRIDVSSSSSSFNPSGITESIFYLLYTFKVHRCILKLYAAVCSVAQEAMELVCKHYIERKLHSSLSHQNLADLVIFLEEAIFDSHTHPTKDDLEKRKKVAFKELEQFIPHLLDKILGSNFTNGVLDLFEILQNPLCNKQLTYTLLDIIVAELFPELECKEGC